MIEREIKFYISGENNIMNASDELGKHHIWHNPCPHYLGIPFKLDFDPDYKSRSSVQLIIRITHYGRKASI